MIDYIETLEQRLAALAASERETQRMPVRMWQRRRWSMWTLLPSGGLTAIAIAALTFVLLACPTEHATALAALATPTVNAESTRSQLPMLDKAGMVFSRAHLIETAFGVGYVMATADQSTVCIAIPDRPTGFGTSCAPVSEVRHHGLLVSLIAADRSSGPSEIVVLVPDDTDTARLEFVDGGSQELRISGGVATAEITRNVDLLLTVGGRVTRQRINAVEPQGGWAYQCVDRHIFTFKHQLPAAKALRLCASHGGPRGG